MRLDRLNNKVLGKANGRWFSEPVLNFCPLGYINQLYYTDPIKAQICKCKIKRMIEIKAQKKPHNSCPVLQECEKSHHYV